MDFFDLVKLLLRWWLVTVPIMVLTVVAAIVVSQSIQPEFTARGSVQLVGPLATPSADGDDDGYQTNNPLLSVNGALPVAAYVTALSMTSPQVTNLLADEGLSTSFDVGAETRLPIISIETRASSRTSARDTVLRLIELIDEDLRLRQDAAVVPADDRVTANVIKVAVVGGADYGGRKRLQIAVLALGGLLAVGAAFLAEGIRARRARSVAEERAGAGRDPGDPAVGVGPQRAGEVPSASNSAGGLPPPDQSERSDDDFEGPDVGGPRADTARV